jgi:putative ABC transport system permease protein
MSIWRAARSGLRSLVRREHVEQELDDELRHYLAMAAQENVRRGMSPAAAERAARVQMGGLEATKAQVRWGGWEGSVEWLWQDLRVAARGLRRSPGFTAVAVISLALGIGAVTTMFSVVNAVMFRPLPYHDADRVVMIWTDDVRRGLRREGTAWLTISDWRARNTTLRDVAYFSVGRIAPVANDQSRGRARRAVVSTNLFALLGARPLHGRLISSADEQEPVAVISHSFWQRWFAGALDIVGKPLLVDDASKGGVRTLTVIGVLPPDFYFPDRLTAVWTPAAASSRERIERFQHWARRWTAVARLNDVASVDDARRDLDRIGRQLAATHMTGVPDFPGFATTVLPVLETIAGANLRSALWLLLGAVGVVLLVVCANLANLLMARGATRYREFAVRRALGAGRGRLVRQLVVESMLLVLVGGLAGSAIAAAATPLLGAAVAAYVPRMDEIAFDARVLLFAVSVSFLAGLAFGIAPALRLSGTGASEALREAGRGTGSVRLRRTQGLMVLAECALAMVLLAFAGLLLKSMNRLQSVDPGFDPRGVLALRLEFPSQTATPAETTQGSTVAKSGARAREQLAHGLASRVAAIPGVSSVGFIDDLFISSQGNKSITIPGRDASEIAAGELTDGLVTPGFFPAMRVPLRRGRLPTREDAARRIEALFTPVITGQSLAEKERLAIPEPVVVNEAFVRRFFPGEDPLRKRFCVDPTNKTYWYEIVGVVGDMRRQGLERAPIPQYYGAWIPSGGGRVDLIVRAEGDPLALAPLVRRAVALEVPSVSIATVSTVEQQLGDFTAQRRLQTSLLTLFALLGLALAAVGVFGLSHYAVAERTREIGVRVALGASPGDVLRLLVGQGMRMPAVGIAIGLAVSLGVTRVISSQLFGVEPTDPPTFAVVGGALAIVAASACYLAARRGAHADPVEALRQE